VLDVVAAVQLVRVQEVEGVLQGRLVTVVPELARCHE